MRNAYDTNLEGDYSAAHMLERQHEKEVTRLTDALLIATSKLDAAERDKQTMLAALKLAAKYVSKMVADDVQTAVPPANALRVIEHAIAVGRNPIQAVVQN